MFKGIVKQPSWKHRDQFLFCPFPHSSRNQCKGACPFLASASASALSLGLCVLIVMNLARCSDLTSLAKPWDRRSCTSPNEDRRYRKAEERSHRFFSPPP